MEAMGFNVRVCFVKLTTVDQSAPKASSIV